MVAGSGMGSSFGVSAETTVNTRVAPARHFYAKTASINRTAERVQGTGIQSGAIGELLSHYIETVNGVEATVSMDVPYSKFGLILNQFMGGSVSPVQQASTAAYLQTHTLTAETVGKSMTAQVGAPYRGGTVSPQEGVGLKVQSMEFSCEAKGLLTCNLKMDGYKFDDSQSLAATSYVTQNKPFNGTQMVLKLGTYASEAAVTATVREVSMTFERPLDTDDYTASGGGRKNEATTNGPVKITGSLVSDWTSAAKAAFQDRVIANTSCSLVWEFTDATAIASSYYPYIRFTLPSVIWTGDTQGVDGPAELKSTWNFEWKYDGTNLPKIEYMSTDTAL